MVFQMCWMLELKQASSHQDESKIQETTNKPLYKVEYVYHIIINLVLDDKYQTIIFVLD